MKYFLDTNICIYFLNGTYPKLRNRFKRTSPNDIKIPSLVKAELLYGVEKSIRKKENLKLVTDFLFPFEIVPFDNSCVTVYSTIRFDLEKSGNIIGPNDLIIASTVLAHQGTLITRSTEEFKRVKNLKVRDWI